MDARIQAKPSFCIIKPTHEQVRFVAKKPLWKFNSSIAIKMESKSDSKPYRETKLTSEAEDKNHQLQIERESLEMAKSKKVSAEFLTWVDPRRVGTKVVFEVVQPHFRTQLNTSQLGWVTSTGGFMVHRASILNNELPVPDWNFASSLASFSNIRWMTGWKSLRVCSSFKERKRRKTDSSEWPRKALAANWGKRQVAAANGNHGLTTSVA